MFIVLKIAIKQTPINSGILQPRFDSHLTRVNAQRCRSRAEEQEGARMLVHEAEWTLMWKMAAEGGGKESNEIKTQFSTREGVYKLLPNSEYSRPNRVPFNSQGSSPVKVSFVNVNDQSGNGERICFSVGRELYFYIYKGVRKVTAWWQLLGRFRPL